MMTVADVKRQVKEIKRASVYDDEKAHRLEDSLFIEVLKAIANKDCRSPLAIAREALKSWDIDFGRWFD